jgi:phosphatidylinositol 4-kinase
LLVESEISRLTVWKDVVNVQHQGSKAGQLEKSVSLVCPIWFAWTIDDADIEAEWTKLVAKAWRISPHMAVHMGERFKYPAVQHELTRLVRSDPKAVIGVSEAIFYLLGDKFDPASRRALQVHLSSLYRVMTDK